MYKYTIALLILLYDKIPVYYDIVCVYFGRKSFRAIKTQLVKRDLNITQTP